MGHVSGHVLVRTSIGIHWLVAKKFTDELYLGEVPCCICTNFYLIVEDK